VAHTAADERMLTGLHPARRNRYYYGKMLDVSHLSMEQRYVLGKQWLFNRAVIGPGVVCGLTVEPLTTAEGSGVLIRSGLAFDGWGREIVVPDDIAIVPLALTDPCGEPTTKSLPAKVTMQICYRECDTDFAPAMVNDPSCGCGDDCEAGTVVETFCVRVVAGTADEVTMPCLDDVKAAMSSGDLHAVLCELSKQCAPDPDDPCLTLANITVAGDGTLTVDDCGPRMIAPTNRMLAQLIRCCCFDGGSTPPPPVSALLRVVDVKAVRAVDDPAGAVTVLGVLKAPDDTLTLPAAEEFPNAIDITFDAAVPWDTSSATLGQSVVVKPASAADKLITFPSMLRIYRPDGFPPSRRPYKFVVVGGPGGAGPASPAITATSGTRLDGDYPPGLPSGDGTEGGDFTFLLQVN
jgi:hypothetical protein